MESRPISSTIRARVPKAYDDRLASQALSVSVGTRPSRGSPRARDDRAEHATMLSYIMTDAEIAVQELDRLLRGRDVRSTCCGGHRHEHVGTCVILANGSQAGLNLTPFAKAHDRIPSHD